VTDAARSARDGGGPAVPTRLGRRLAGRPWGPVVAGYLVGLVLARLLSPLLPVSLGPLSLPLTAVALPVLFVLAPGLAIRPSAFGARTRVAVGAATGVLGDELVYVGLRADGVGYWSLPSVAGSVLLAAVAVAVAVGVSRAARAGGPTPGESTGRGEPTPGESTGRGEPTPGESTGRGEPTPGESAGRDDPTLPPAVGRRFGALLAVIVGGSFVGFRASQEYLRASGVPNESRSLVLFGHEIHHGTGGSLLLLVGAAAVATRGLDRRSHRAAALLVALGCGFVADQYPYLFYARLTDAAYFTTLSIVGGLVLTVTIILVVWNHVRMADTQDEDTVRGADRS